MGFRARGLTASAIAVLVVVAHPAASSVPDVPPRAPAGSPWLIPPVDGPVIRKFDAPTSRFGAGHRGIDLRSDPGVAVRAAASGTVAFAGRVGSTVAVTLDHARGISTTYSSLSEILVQRGEMVSAGSWIGRVGEAHDGAEAALHLGVKVEGSYVDPETLLSPIDVSSAIHLAPLSWRPPDALGPEFSSAFEVTGFTQACNPQDDLHADLEPPNDNIAVAVAGIGSRTEGGVHADMYEHGPEQLGYSEERIYRFSYKGTRGADLHEPYSAEHTWDDINSSARKLETLMEEIARLNPGRAVDLIAHSQGGIVARTYLATVAQESDAHLPRVDHLVTFSSPHEGATIAELRDELPRRTLTGRAVIEGVSRWARRGGPIPDPLAPAVGQLAPGSELLGGLAREDLLYGTRGLALSIPHDVVVPAHRADLAEETSRVVPPSGVNGHSAVVTSARARSLAHSFLRDAPDPCRSAWDVWGPRAGQLVERAERSIPRLVAKAEIAAIKRVVRLLVP